MFVRDCWYVAAAGAEVNRALLARTIAGEELVFFRTEDGRPAALEDRCPHRLAPLSMGRLVGNSVECGYHGIRFDCSGRCLRIPGDHRAEYPASFGARAYPVLERSGWVWVWLGDPAAADEAALPPEAAWQGAPGRTSQGGYFHVEAHYQLLVDNLLDLSHEAYLHAATIGNAAVGEVPATVRVDRLRVEVERRMPDCAPPPMFTQAARFTGNIDRYQRIVLTPPAFVAIEVWAVPAGTEDRARGLEWWVAHAVTPETATSTHYFWGVSRGFAAEDAALTAMLQKGSERTLGEDKAMLEAQQRKLARATFEDRRIHTAGDVAPARARRSVERMLERERRVGAGGGN